MTVAVVQLTSTDDLAQNLEQIRRHTTAAARAGATFVSLPENATYLRWRPDDRAPMQPLEGPGATVVGELRALARELGIQLLVGSFPEQGPDADHYYNTSVLIDGAADGAPITARYRKLHLFDIDIAGSESQRESDTIARGDEVVVGQVRDVPIGLSICYDLRFPRLYQRLVDGGARIIAVPSAFTEFTGKDHWMVLLRARAIETQTFVVAAGQSGFHGGKRRSFGKSAIVDPWGIVLATAADGPGFALARLDFASQDRIRASLPCLQHRHPKV
ncbi:MAG: carbon-nitrogen hydrolase family protein [Polyangiaceae bacterium]|nr:carbon-nitrogen hydrolase family protein [Polyangiaceae bacterium]